MSLHYLALAQIDRDVLQSLIDNKIREDRSIEYKAELPGYTEDAKREFRFDVSSFANAGGGDIVFGLTAKKHQGEATGEPEAFNPLRIAPDTEEARLYQILLMNIEPRIPGVRVHFVRIADGQYVGVVRIPRSWNTLHVVRFNDAFRIYGRTSNGKYIMDVSEIRSGFVAADSGFERIRKFRHQRIAQIKAEKAPVDLPRGPKLILHVFPFSALDPTIEFPVEPAHADHAFQPLWSGGGWNHRHNFDGFIKFSVRSDIQSSTYLQFFRNGSLEACTSRFFDVGHKLLNMPTLEKQLIISLQKYLQFLNHVGVSTPLSVALSVIDVCGYSIQYNTFRWTVEAVPFRDNDLFVPEFFIESMEVESEKVLRPAFDRIWNAAGIECSLHYDNEGKWRLQ